MIVGVLGAGQLSQMMFLAGSQLGIKFVVYSDVPTKFFDSIGNTIVGSFNDFDKIKSFIDAVDVITFENENIPKETIEFIELHKKGCYPSLKALRISQDRLVEKNFLNSISIPTSKFIEINGKKDLLHYSKDFGYQAILKKRRFGYDGKGQFRISNANDLENISEQDCDNTILEELIQFDREISVIAVRTLSGDISYYDICENTHQAGILRKTVNQINDPSFARACKLMADLMTELDYIGVCCLEIFQVGDELLANEMAPRVHNSGHWTIEGAVTSQFENHVRAILGLPIGDTSSTNQYVMFNLISSFDKLQLLQENAYAKLHDYQKEPRKNRKLGHVTILKKQANNA